MKIRAERAIAILRWYAGGDGQLNPIDTDAECQRAQRLGALAIEAMVENRKFHELLDAGKEAWPRDMHRTETAFFSALDG